MNLSDYRTIEVEQLPDYRTIDDVEQVLIDDQSAVGGTVTVYIKRKNDKDSVAYVLYAE